AHPPPAQDPRAVRPRRDGADRARGRVPVLGRDRRLTGAATRVLARPHSGYWRHATGDLQGLVTHRRDAGAAVGPRGTGRRACRPCLGSTRGGRPAGHRLALLAAAARTGAADRAPPAASAHARARTRTRGLERAGTPAPPQPGGDPRPQDPAAG